MSESRESRMVTLRRNPDGTPSVWCDPEIADLVSALNAGGVPTVASCSGHGERPGIISLADGRELIIARHYAEARAIESAWNARAMLSARPESPPNGLPSEECSACHPNGVYDTEGNGPYDCYACGKPAPKQEPSNVE